MCFFLVLILNCPHIFFVSYHSKWHLLSFWAVGQTEQTLGSCDKHCFYLYLNWFKSQTTTYCNCSVIKGRKLSCTFMVHVLFRLAPVSTITAVQQYYSQS